MRKEPNFSRRIIIYAVVAFCFTMLTWLAWEGQADSELHLLIAKGCFYLVAAVVLFYVLGANLDLALQVLAARFGAAPSTAAAPKGRGAALPQTYMPPP